VGTGRRQPGRRGHDAAVAAGSHHAAGPGGPRQAMKLVDHYDVDFAMYVRLAATTGARRSQLVALRWIDVDLRAKTITFARAIVHGGPDVGFVERGTKTGMIWKVALATSTAERLKDYRELCRERAEAVGTKLAKDGFVFNLEPDGSVSWRPRR